MSDFTRPEKSTTKVVTFFGITQFQYGNFSILIFFMFFFFAFCCFRNFFAFDRCNFASP